MTWPAVARRYAEFRARSDEDTRAPHRVPAQTLASRPAGLPEINLEHVRALTDDTGILQHAASAFRATRTATASTTTRGACC